MAMVRNILCALIILLLAGCTEKKPVSVGGTIVPAALLNTADDLSFDYTGQLAKAKEKNADALKALLLLSRNIETAPIASLHGEVLRELLLHTGDDFFATTIASMSESERNTAWPALEIAFDNRLKNSAPLTWQALLPAASAEEHQGLYVFDPQMSTFQDCGTPTEKYYAVDETGEIEKNYRSILKKAYPGQAIYAAVKGFKTDYFGLRTLPANFAGFFIVTEIVELAEKNYRNTCIPYEFWALGTEPFWVAQISSMEAVIEFKSMDDERARLFAYAHPIQEDTVKVYAAVNQDTGDNIRITVKQEPCSDGMSDRQYEHSVDLTMNGKNFKGCAISFEARNNAVEGE